MRTAPSSNIWGFGSSSAPFAPNPRRICSALVAASLVALASHSFAQTPSDDDDEPYEAPPEPGAGTPRDYAPDLRRGAVLVTVGTGLLAPVGESIQDVALPGLVAPGLGLRAAAGFGLSRHLSLELMGTYGMFSAGETCVSCSGSTFGLGFGITYHLAQGIAFDPWASIGMNYRAMTIETSADSAIAGVGSYSGWDFARIALGGTYYPAPFVGFGPYLEAAVGTFRLLPDGRSGSGVHAFIDFGLRVTFDPLRPGKLAPQKATASR